MKLIEAISLFLSWPDEIKSACIFAMNEQPDSDSTAQANVKPITRERKVAANKQSSRYPNYGKPWELSEKDVAFEYFEKYGRDICGSLSKEFGRTEKAVHNLYDAWLRMKSKQKQNAQ